MLGEQRPEVIVELVRSGRVTEERVDESVRRLLREKFTLGLFEKPYGTPTGRRTPSGRASSPRSARPPSAAR
ncbi:hypothetical protein ACFXI6_37525 [Streptomyces mirabilis]|uniref:hypothetical protein n=1 Tax=Streptomyces mirabilis TaxID=68239 RepID=UPI003698A0A5